MHTVSHFLVGLLVVVGILVGGMSLYMASLTGVMNKMGLVGGDFRQSVKQNELARQLRERDVTVDCGIWQVAKQVPLYFLSKGTEKITLSGTLGRERVICGILLVQRGNVERGVYTIIKGLYYLQSQYHEMRGVVLSDPRACQLLDQPDYEAWVQGYLLSTEGRIYDVVFNVYKQVEIERAGVLELCMD